MNQTMNSDATIPEIWNTVIRKIGGQHIKSLSMSTTQFNNFTDTSNMTTTVLSDAILLKSSKSIILCTYNLEERSIIWESPIEEIERLFYYPTNNHHIIILKSIDDGLFWLFRIET